MHVEPWYIYLNCLMYMFFLSDFNLAPLLVPSYSNFLFGLTNSLVLLPFLIAPLLNWAHTIWESFNDEYHKLIISNNLIILSLFTYFHFESVFIKLYSLAFICTYSFLLPYLFYLHSLAEL